MQVELGQEGYVKSRINQNNFASEEYLNFRDFELLLKKMLAKAGYKPPH